MDPDMGPDTDPDNDAEAAAMAQAMGFSSFGAQDRPSKKRRYNSATDARVSVTGSNSTPLGVPSAKIPTNTEEIDLQDEEENEGKIEVEGDNTTPLQKSSQGSLPPPPAGLPARPAPGMGFVGSSTSRPGGPPAQRQHEEHRQKEYYDWSVNENPWERLEKAMGLETDGDWVPRASRAAAAS
ncbi:hypothetical protein E4U16_006181 [Claviceps sp. LM84 group G4]|nr:hypothetical protein E4U16_006181 [Claviceps sp. LM84 group G4]